MVEWPLPLQGENLIYRPELVGYYKGLAFGGRAHPVAVLRFVWNVAFARYLSIAHRRIVQLLSRTDSWEE